MLNNIFTVEEINLIAIFKADTVAATLDNITEALPDIYNEELITISESASRKLAALTEQEFSALSFTFADEDEGGEYE